MKKSELKQLIRECYKEVLQEAAGGSIYSEKFNHDVIYMLNEAGTNVKIEYVTEGVDIDQVKRDVKKDFEKADLKWNKTGPDGTIGGYYSFETNHGASGNFYFNHAKATLSGNVVSSPEGEIRMTKWHEHIKVKNIKISCFADKDKKVPLKLPPSYVVAQGYQGQINENLPMGKSDLSRKCTLELNAIISEKIDLPTLQQPARHAAAKIIELIDKSLNESTFVHAIVEAKPYASKIIELIEEQKKVDQKTQET